MRAQFTTHEFPLHSHEAFVIAVTEHGGSEVKSRGLIQQAHHNALFVFNPAEPHAGWLGRSPRWQYRSFYLSRSGMDRLAQDLGVRELPYFTRNKFGDPDLIDMFLALHQACERQDEARREMLVETFGKLFARHGSTREQIPDVRKDREALVKALEVIHDRFREPLHLDDLSGAVHLTSFQVIGLFKRELGLTPHAYLMQVRLSAACRSLRRGVPIADAALGSGFYDQSALNNHFKRCYAITPLQFATANRAARRHG
jgi:AraC-like DNA-binding protein